MNPEQASRSVTAAAQQMQARADEASDLLKAMANPQRLRVLCLLVEGEKSVGEINAAIDLSQSALSQHLAVLREQSLVVTRRDSQVIYYSVADGPAHKIIETLHDIYCAPGQPAAGRSKR